MISLLQIALLYPEPESDITNVNDIDRLVDLVQGTMVEAYERPCHLSLLAASKTFSGRVMSKILKKCKKTGIEVTDWPDNFP